MDGAATVVAVPGKQQSCLTELMLTRACSRLKRPWSGKHQRVLGINARGTTGMLLHHVRESGDSEVCAPSRKSGGQCGRDGATVASKNAADARSRGIRERRGTLLRTVSCVYG